METPEIIHMIHGANVYSAATVAECISAFERQVIDSFSTYSEHEFMWIKGVHFHVIPVTTYQIIGI